MLQACFCSCRICVRMLALGICLSTHNGRFNTFCISPGKSSSHHSNDTGSRAENCSVATLSAGNSRITHVPVEPSTFGERPLMSSCVLATVRSLVWRYPEAAIPPPHPPPQLFWRSLQLPPSVWSSKPSNLHNLELGSKQNIFCTGER